ncbi:MAG TPA: hypothetical protein DCY49_03370 [Candidatus Jacksonbacteria bacterium]|uniref:Uncharacterized protein n=1 Tax=candidate division CPR1 bacterium GW2011_GWA2_42_17 TaxID=1618341 RepID=A0A0G0Z6K6_9BACT|nr:MAG: hypothetical protein UV05_C0007G0010 [candidate division CPR1 bacterium GW2011_GWA2_42_17]OGY71018.1 MAG: hypothetical protein A2986_00885 [Candidatus Jacksonbacteria bacterium RIFCSPLOWO2_01_FULL_44_13]HAZ16916.1 hypothetical protein [Candidatus Jacksonbacteria bacterium]
MHHKKELLIIVIVLAVITAGVFAIVVTQKQSSQSQVQTAPTVLLAEPPENLEPTYRAVVQKEWDEMLLAVSARDGEKLQTIISTLLETKVPASMKNLHVKLVLALSDAQDAIPVKDEKILATVSQILENIEKEYPWVGL